MVLLFVHSHIKITQRTSNFAPTLEKLCNAKAKMEFNINRNVFGSIPECRKNFLLLKNCVFFSFASPKWLQEPISLVNPTLIYFLSSERLIFVNLPTWNEKPRNVPTTVHHLKAHTAWQT